jgi:hypothetical protein
MASLGRGQGYARPKEEAEEKPIGDEDERFFVVVYSRIALTWRGRAR